MFGGPEGLDEAERDSRGRDGDEWMISERGVAEK
jgi:hypothetical protein